MAFLDESTWRGKVFSGGWKAAAGGEAPVIEPATGAELSRTGIASPAAAFHPLEKTLPRQVDSSRNGIGPSSGVGQLRPACSGREHRC